MEVKHLEGNRWEYTIGGETKTIAIATEDKEEVIKALTPTEETIAIEKARYEKLKTIEDSIKYLKKTDWVVTKTAETYFKELRGYVPEGTTLKLEEKYKDVFVKREECRENL